MCDYYILPGNGFVDQVGYLICRRVKMGSSGYVPHGEDEVKPYQLRVSGVFLVDEEGNRWNVLHPHPQPHVGVYQVYLAEV